MSDSAHASPLTVALIGNPNTGKSTLFNLLCGVRQRVGNFPGVTVEKKIGQSRHGERTIQVIDLPGTYSLAPRSPDEMVTVDVLLGRSADAPSVQAVVAIVDASNLERNLYLASQVLELELPTVLAVNMMDVARSRGITLDLDGLSQRLGIPVVALEAHRGRGLGELKDSLLSLESRRAGKAPSPFSPEFDAAVAKLSAHLHANCLGENGDGTRPPTAHDTSRWPKYLVERLLLDASGYLESRLLSANDAATREQLSSLRAMLAEQGQTVPGIEAAARYGWIARQLSGIVERPRERVRGWTDRIDRVLTHKLWGSLVFVLLMALSFQAVFSWAAPLMDAISAGVDQVSSFVEQWVEPGPVRSLLVDGLLAGVGGVLVFLPQIFILFFFIALLEDCGYMARAAYLMDKLMVRVGLSGKSFIPLLSSYACAVPGIMAARVIENRRDRLTTILIAPLMSCSARLPVYTVMIAAFIPARRVLGVLSLQGLTMAAMYAVGSVAAVLAALVLKRTILRGPTPPFVMELPAYKWPSPRTVLYRMVERGYAFVRRAGTLIVAVSVVVWAMLYYPHDSQVEAPFAGVRMSLSTQLHQMPEGDPKRQAVSDALAQVERQIDGAYQRQSLLGKMGRAIEPAVRPLGWDWRLGAAAIASFPAREVVVATLGIIYNLGSEIDVENREDASRLEAALRGARWEGTDRPVYNVAVALSVMVFFALCAQCASTLVVMRRETDSWRWPALAFVYMTALAYVGALVTYQVASRLGS